MSTVLQLPILWWVHPLLMIRDGLWELDSEVFQANILVNSVISEVGWQMYRILELILHSVFLGLRWKH